MAKQDDKLPKQKLAPATASKADKVNEDDETLIEKTLSADEAVELTDADEADEADELKSGWTESEKTTARPKFGILKQAAANEDDEEVEEAATDDDEVEVVDDDKEATAETDEDSGEDEEVEETAADESDEEDDSVEDEETVAADESDEEDDSEEDEEVEVEETAADESDEDDSEEDEEDHEKVMSSTRVNLYKLMAKEKLSGQSSLELVASSLEGGYLYMFVNGQPVAKLNPALASSEIRQIWATEAVAKMFLAAVKEDGLDEETEKKYGVEPLVAEIPVEKVTQQQIEEAVKDAQDKLEEERNETDAATAQALSIALLAQTKGLLKMRNPLRSVLKAKLAQAGVEDADEIIDEAYDEAAPEMVEEVMSKVAELRNRSVEAMNVLASTIEDAPYSSARTVASILSNKLANGSVAVASVSTTPQIVATASTNQSPSVTKKFLASISGGN